MKRIMFEFYPPSEKQKKKMMDTGLFVFDTNFLLNLYRYKKETSDKFIKILEKLSNKVWLPHQIAYEYQKNRLLVIDEMEKSCENLIKTINDNIAVGKKNINESLSSEFSRYPINISKDIIKKIENKFDDLNEYLKKNLQNYPKRNENDDILNFIEKIFRNKIGNPYTRERLREIKYEGLERFDDQTPPGYMDDEKDGKQKFGDLIIWFQIIDKGKESKKPIIFITDDGKEDWWHLKKKEKISPRPELIREIYDEAGVRFYIYSPDRFLRYAGEYLKEEIKKETINEVKRVSSSTLIEIEKAPILLRNEEKNIWRTFRSVSDRPISSSNFSGLQPQENEYILVYNPNENAVFTEKKENNYEYFYDYGIGAYRKRKKLHSLWDTTTEENRTPVRWFGSSQKKDETENKENKNKD
jgi:hypothetical protein